MTISVRAINIIVVVFPVLRTGVVRRINIDAVNLFHIKVFQQLEGMVIVRLNQRMPKFTVRSVLHNVNRFQCRINRLAEFRDRYKLIHPKCFLLMRFPAVALDFFTVYLHDGIDVADVSGFYSHLGSDTDRHVIQRRAFWQMFLEH